MSDAPSALPLYGGDRLRAFNIIKRLAGEHERSLVSFIARRSERDHLASLRAVAGVQNKVLEAMAAGRPVVTTSLVNRGLGAKPERDLLVADDAPETARQVVRLLQDAALRARLGQAARQFVRHKFTWDCAAERMRRVQANLAAISTRRYQNTEA